MDRAIWCSSSPPPISGTDVAMTAHNPLQIRVASACVRRRPVGRDVRYRDSVVHAEYQTASCPRATTKVPDLAPMVSSLLDYPDDAKAANRRPTRKLDIRRRQRTGKSGNEESSFIIVATRQFGWNDEKHSADMAPLRVCGLSVGDYLSKHHRSHGNCD